MSAIAGPHSDPTRQKEAFGVISRILCPADRQVVPGDVEVRTDLRVACKKVDRLAFLIGNRVRACRVAAAVLHLTDTRPSQLPLATLVQLRFGGT